MVTYVSDSYNTHRTMKRPADLDTAGIKHTWEVRVYSWNHEVKGQVDDAGVHVKPHHHTPPPFPKVHVHEPTLQAAHFGGVLSCSFDCLFYLFWD